MNRVEAGHYELAAPPASPPRLAGFRTKLLLAMMLIVSAVAGLALYFAQRGMTASVENELEREFQAQIVALHNAQDVRHAALTERCRALVRRSRIQAALEDNALDLLYLSADDELRDIIARPADGPIEPGAQGLRAEFYRFLDRQGALISPDAQRAVGPLPPAVEAQLALPKGPEAQQLGYVMGGRAPNELSEIIAVPIISLESADVIAVLALGFKPFELAPRSESGMKSGIWLNGRLHSSMLSETAAATLAAWMREQGRGPGDAVARRITLDGVEHLLFYKQLNPGSAYPAAYEVCVFPLTQLLARQRQLRWQVIGAGAFLLLVGLGVSHVASSRLSAPVEKLAVDSEANRALRARAEAALEMTSVELQRAARFSADASHQLKTPVTVLRAGLEELLTRENLTPDECDQLSQLIHQTYRLSSLIDDLLLLSRMDAGRLKLQLGPVDLTQLIEASLDDLSALPNESELNVETDFPPGLTIQGEKRYTAIILQNLLENARKYNRRGGTVRVVAREIGDAVRLTISNTGPGIGAVARVHVFERFHRGAMGENVPGYGLGLNLARELARLHQGDLRLVRSDADWTEFEVTFRRGAPAPTHT
ncbi:MAG: HAMP domain-containing sensor histidine kinase [Opitutaceae bacterium]|nr:HAMP domain-containing sensor histidine kinase [Opitutaceae bacterium]